MAASLPNVVEANTSQELKAQLIKAKETPSMLLFFLAPWCGPCREVHGTWLESARSNPTIPFIEANFDECQDHAYEIGVNNLPAFVHFAYGMRQEVYIGAARAKVGQFLNRVLSSPSSPTPPSTPTPLLTDSTPLISSPVQPPSTPTPSSLPTAVETQTTPTPTSPTTNTTEPGSPPALTGSGGVKYQVHYFKAAGRAECIRLLLSICGADWENVFVGAGRVPWPGSRPNYAFEQLPGLKVIFPNDDQQPFQDGRNEIMLVQSHAILRYLGTVLNMEGPNDLLLRAICTVFEEGLREINDSLAQCIFFSEDRDKSLQFYLKNRYWVQLLGLEKQLVMAHARLKVVAPELADGPYLCGKELSWWDVYALEMQHWLRRAGAPMVTPEKTPLLFELATAVKAHPKIAEYFTTPKEYEIVVV